MRASVNGKEVILHPTFHAINTPVARREWICALCGRKLSIGERYTRYTIRKKYHIDDLKYHDTCWQLIKFYCKQEDTNLYTAKKVLDWLKNRRICRLCSSERCVIHSCEKVRKFIKYKPYMTKFDKLKPMDDKTIPPEYGFKFVDEIE